MPSTPWAPSASMSAARGNLSSEREGGVNLSSEATIPSAVKRAESATSAPTARGWSEVARLTCGITGHELGPA